MSKTVSTKRARRPKKVYAKGWETRRRNRDAAQDAASLILSINKQLPKAPKGWEPVSVAEAAQMQEANSTIRSHSEEELFALIRHHATEINSVAGFSLGRPEKCDLMQKAFRIFCLASMLPERAD